MLFAARLFDGTGMRANCRVEVAGGRVSAVVADSAPQDGDVLVEHGVLAPGLVDVQINGYAGTDFAAGTTAEIGAALARLAAAGTTSCLPTIITDEVDAQLASIGRLAAAQQAAAGTTQARVLGVHVEGPFISPLRKGAHRAELMRDPDAEVIARYLAQPIVRLMTLAPERDGALDAIKQLAAAGVVASIGHTDATADVVHAAADHGASMVTHLFNAQRPFGHREPGVPGAALADARYFLGLIADLHHVAPDIVRVVFAAAADRTVLVTDALASTGMPGGTYELGGESIVVAEPGEPARRLDGTMAGSGLSMATAVANCVRIGVPVEQALRAATSTPAAVLGREDIGRLAVGTHADLVWLDDDLRVRDVWVGGQRMR